MTRDEVMALAKQAGLDSLTRESIERFARLVEQATAEKCAALCDEQQNEPECPERAQYCADAIREKFGLTAE